MKIRISKKSKKDTYRRAEEFLSYGKRPFSSYQWKEIIFINDSSKRIKKNSKELFKEANFLYKKKFYRTSLFLTIATLEEIGKAFALFEFFMILGNCKSEISSADKKRIEEIKKNINKHHDWKLELIFQFIHRHSSEVKKISENDSRFFSEHRSDLLYSDLDFKKLQINSPLDISLSTLKSVRKKLSAYVKYCHHFIFNMDNLIKDYQNVQKYMKIIMDNKFSKK